MDSRSASGSNTPHVAMGDVLNVLGGYAFKSKDYSPNGCPVIRIANLDHGPIELSDCARIPEGSIGKGERFKLEPGDTLIAMSGATTGKLGFVPDDLTESWYLNQRVGAFRISDESKIERNYLRHYLASEQYQKHVWNLAAGAAQPNISGKQLESATIPLPALAEQKRIAAILDAADKLRAKRREAIAQLDTLLQSTFLDMFGDPVTNPMGWDVLSAGDALSNELFYEIQDGNHGELHPKVADFSESGVPFVMANCLVNGELDVEKAYKLDECWLDKLRIGFSKSGDVLLSHKGTIGATAVVPDKLDVAVLSPQVTYYRVSDSVDPYFLAEMFNTQGFQVLLAKEAKQSTRAYIGITRQKKLKFIFPPIKLQRKYSGLVKNIRGLADSKRKHLSELDHLFSSLQQRAFDGTL